MMIPFGLRNRDELLDRLGDINQLAGFQRCFLAEGKGKGNEIIYVRNGSGLSFSISVSRGFDIGACEFDGIPMAWRSANGPVMPSFYEKDTVEWHRNFEAGMLATSGITYMGKPNIDQGRSLGQHGKISSTPAELLQTEAIWQDGIYEQVFRGKLRENISHGKHLTLYRTISTQLGDNSLIIKDLVVNESSVPVEHMILYHFNFGYPLISETCSISIPQGPKRWIDGQGKPKDWNVYEHPADLDQSNPTVLLHEDVVTEDGLVTIQIKNRIKINGKEKTVLARLQYEKKQLPYLTQWKHPLKGVYVLGIEPGNASTEGRHIHRERGTLVQLAPRERKEYQLKLSFQLEEDAI